MLGLRPRLKARNSLWDLVNKHPLDLPSSSPLSRKQPVEEGADGLPDLRFSSSLSSPEQKSRDDHSSEGSHTSSMAPVSPTTFITYCSPADQANGSQRKIRKGHGRRLEKSNMVRLQWRRVLGIQELDDANGKLAQDPSSPSQGMMSTRKSDAYTF